MSEFVYETCPHCGNALQVPRGLEEFSCIYCGKRCRLKAMRSANTVDESKYNEQWNYLHANLVGAVVNYPEYYKKITKKDFSAAFEAYENENAQTVDCLDLCARFSPDGRDGCIRKVCTDLLDQLEVRFKADPQWAKKSRREKLLFNTRVVLAIFLTPLVSKRRLETAETFRRELVTQWSVRFPSQKWIPGDYDVLSESFGKRKLCFITTATCLHEGKSDLCDELQAFRTFRDGYLTENGGQKEIELYYGLAPTIVTAIEYLDDADAVYAEIRQKWLSPCYTALLENRPADCRKIYTDMVTVLQAKYFQ